MDVIFNCSNCNQEIEVDEAGVGHEIDCPSCGIKLVIPPPDPNRKPAAASAPVDAPAPAEAVAGEVKPAESKEAEPPKEGEAPKAPPAPEPKKVLSVPQHDSHSEILVKKVEAKGPAKDAKKILRTRTIRRNQCMEVGHDLFDEKITEFITKTGEENIQSITPIGYSYIDTVGHVLNDYGVLIIYKG